MEIDPEPVTSAGPEHAQQPPSRPARLWQLRREVPHPVEFLLMGAVFVAGLGAAAALLEVMLESNRIGVVLDPPLWGKVAFSFLAILLFSVHVHLLRRARDADLDVARAADTPLGRGEVRAGDYDMLAILVVGVEGALLASVGEIRLTWWAVGLVFSFLMRIDFGMRLLLRSRPVVRSVAHGLVYAVVFAMLVALAFEAGIGLGLFPISSTAEGDFGPVVIEFEGLTPLDVLVVEPLLLGMLYAGAAAWGMAAELGGIRRDAALGLGLVGTAIFAAYAWQAIDSRTALLVGATGVAAAVAGRWSRLADTGPWLAIAAPALVLGASGLVEIGWIP